MRCYGITDSFKEMQDSSLVTCQRSVYEETTDQERELQPEVSQEKRDFEVAAVSSSSKRLRREDLLRTSLERTGHSLHLSNSYDTEKEMGLTRLMMKTSHREEVN